ncbi:MAG: hypothetical protein IJF62_02535 [Firmicutes bacterium]|nr:hypothetical protein [Bacillota bacterium]MBQ3111647.1 hypothetical protein [Bacillota bacterium]MBQ6842705.1 hypothetical protein [Bacillota bacterium]
MIKVRQLLGMAVYGPDRHRVIGRVCDIAVAADGTICGVVVECGGFFSRRRFISRADIASIGLGGIVTNGQRGSKHAPQHLLLGQNKFIGSVLDKERGRISDAVVENDRIIGVEISQGLLQDLKQGRGFIEWNELGR